MKKQHDLYVKNLVCDINVNPRDFYRSKGIVKSLKKDTQGVPPLKRRNGSGLADSELEQTDEFNDQLTDVFNKSVYTHAPTPFQIARLLSWEIFMFRLME